MPVSSEELDATWRAAGVDPTALAVDSDGTLTRRFHARAGTGLDDLDTLTGGAGEVELGEELGQGGMGVVYLARQLSLRRPVAVKAIKPVFAGQAAGELVREARVTGALEHPNVVPVHGLVVDGEGRPMMVMKLLTGRSWATALSAPASRDLDRDLGIFEQLCNAVAFAHQRGVLHRDIKPDNVVLGDFGEVCLVDWGLAVDLGGADIDDLPPLAEVRGIDGTLQYMAPEQVVGRGDVLGVHTDVYLLGATLYQVLCRRPPRRRPSAGQEVSELLLAIMNGACQPIDASVPRELAEVCQRALAVRPEERFRSAIELRDAVAAFRAHRESSAIAAEAGARLARAHAAIEAGDTAAPGVGRELAAARFGFEQALRSWPDNRDAARGLEETLLTAVAREIDVERPDAASALLDELPPHMSRSGHLEAELASLRARIAERRARMEALESAAHESDLGQAARYRRVVGLVMGAVLLVAHLAMDAGARLGWWAVDHAVYLLVTSAIGVAFAAPALLGRRRLFPNQANLRMAYTLGVMLAAQVAVFAGLWHFGATLAATLTVSLVQLAGSIAIKTALLAPRAQWTAAVALGCAGLALAMPSLVLEAVGVAYAVYFFGGGLLSWGDRDPALLLGE